MAFSGALTLTDLNDYLGPSQACIKPVEGFSEEEQAKADQEVAQQEASGPGAASTQIVMDHDGSYYESTGQLLKPGQSRQKDDDKPRARTKLETAEILLSDCLACSGCVTSAESVLITMQSHEEMKRAIQEIRSTPEQQTLLVASISPQTLASLSVRYSFPQEASSSNTPPVPLRTLLHRISVFLKTRFSFDYVLDTTFARHLSLKEHEREFFQRRNNSFNRKRNSLSDLTGLARKKDGAEQEATLPMLASACPGWICYAEKTHGELLPFISRTKSPQQISGVLAKKFIASRLGVMASEGQANLPSVYHVTVMPCYDKKLEASRPDFFEEITGTKEVDCVLTTGELDKLMTEEGFDITATAEGEEKLDADKVADLTLKEALQAGGVGKAAGDNVTILPHFPTLLDHPGSSSGGYMFDLMRAIWLEWLAENWDDFPVEVREALILPKLDVKVIRTSDFTEYVLQAPDISSTSTSQQPILFRAAQCYGFRNLQNLVRKLQKQTGVRSGKGAAGRLVDADGKVMSSGRGRVARGRGRGMLKRGRGGASGSRTATDSEAGSGASTPVLVDGDEEERGYDYVEVMACPGGCVNGGGQIRPPTSSELEASATSATIEEGEESMISKSCSKKAIDADPEGYASGWAIGSSDPSQDIKMLDLNGGETDEKEIKGWQGTTKEWVKRVELAYWQSSPVAHVPVTTLANTPGPDSGFNTPIGTAAAKRDVRKEDKQRILDALVSTSTVGKPGSKDDAVLFEMDSIAYADILAELVANELITITAAVPLTPESLDDSRMKLFRTEYRAVKDELVSGLAVQW